MKPQETFTGIDEVKRGTCGFIMSHIKYVIPNVAITIALVTSQNSYNLYIRFIQSRHITKT